MGNMCSGPPEAEEHPTPESEGRPCPKPAAPAAAAVGAAPPQRLLLHLDLNRTVIMSDTGRAPAEMLSYLLSEVCYGRVVTAAGGNGTDAWEVGPPGTESPSTGPPPPADHRPGRLALLSYKAFVDRQHPFLSDADLVPAGFPSISAANKAAKTGRKLLQHAFCQPGAPGDTPPLSAVSTAVRL